MRKTRQKPRIAGGFSPSNNLGSKKASRGEQLTASPSRPTLRDNIEIGSDQSLLLKGPRQSMTYAKKSSNIFRKSTTQTDNTVIKYSFKNSSKEDSSPPAFSDDESNDLQVTKSSKSSKVLEVMDVTDGVDLRRYGSLRVPCEKVVLGIQMKEIRNKGNGLALMIDLDFQNIALCYDDTKNFIPFEKVESIDISDESLDFKLKFHDYVIDDTKVDRVSFLGSIANIRKLKSLLVLFPENFKKKMKTKARFIGKDFASLNKRKPILKGKAIADPLRLKTPSLTKAFYGVDLGGTIVPRITRSTTKNRFELSPIELDMPPTKKTSEVKIVFKPPLQHKFKDQTMMTIRDEDFQCLYKSQWINDTLIDFFMKYLVENAQTNPIFPPAEDLIEDVSIVTPEDVQVLSSFFFTKLKSTPDHYQNIRKWVSRLPLFEKRIVFIPVNESLHWYCVIIHNLPELLKPGGVCSIYYLDSLEQKHQNIIGPFRDFIKGYAKEKKDLDIDDNQIKLKIGSVPKQPNFNDCGVHVIFNVMKFVEFEKEIIQFWDEVQRGETRIGKLKKESFRKFFGVTQRNSMRVKLQNVLLELQRNQSSEIRPDEEITHQEDEDEIMCISSDEFHGLKNSGVSTQKNSKEATPIPGEHKTLAIEQSQQRDNSKSEGKSEDEAMKDANSRNGVYEHIGSQNVNDEEAEKQKEDIQENNDIGSEKFAAETNILKRIAEILSSDKTDEEYHADRILRRIADPAESNSVAEDEGFSETKNENQNLDVETSPDQPSSSSSTGSQRSVELIDVDVEQSSPLLIPQKEGLMDLAPEEIHSSPEQTFFHSNGAEDLLESGDLVKMRVGNRQPTIEVFDDGNNSHTPKKKMKYK